MAVDRNTFLRIYFVRYKNILRNHHSTFWKKGECFGVPANNRIDQPRDLDFRNVNFDQLNASLPFCMTDD